MIPAGCVAPRSNTPGILGRRALPAGRLARLGATPDFHHGLLKPGYTTRPLATFAPVMAAPARASRWDVGPGESTIPLSTEFRNYGDVLIWTSHGDTETQRRSTRAACTAGRAVRRKPQTNDRATVHWSLVCSWHASPAA